MSKILIVDDDPTLVDFLKLLLESEGYETSEAYDGRMATEVIKDAHPELVLLDYMMPNMHGLDVLRHVNQNHETSFVVMLTGKGSEEVAVECMKAGAADYVVKPFDNDHLLAVIRSVLRLRDAEMQKRKLDEELQSANNRLQTYIHDLKEKGTEIRTLLNRALSALNENRVQDLNAILSEIQNKLD